MRYLIFFFFYESFSFIEQTAVCQLVHRDGPKGKTGTTDSPLPKGKTIRLSVVFLVLVCVSSLCVVSMFLDFLMSIL